MSWSTAMCMTVLTYCDGYFKYFPLFLNSYIIIDNSINQINTKDSTVRYLYLTFVANLITTKLECVNKKAR